MTNVNADIDKDINDDSEQDQDLDNQDEDTAEELDDDSDEDDSDNTFDSDSDEDEDDSDSSGTDDSDEEKPVVKKRVETTIDRLRRERDEWREKAGGGDEKPKTPSKVKTSTEDHALLARLENRGVMHPDDQAYVIKFAKADGISPIDALKDQVVKDRLESNKKTRLQNKSTPTPSNRVGKVTKNLDYWINKGTLPSDPDLAEKVQTEMARRAKAGR